MSSAVDPWRPVHVEDPKELRALINDPHIEVIDTIDRQYRELAQMLPASDRVRSAEPPRWYFFPWRRSVVHVLGPGDFHALRTDRNRNKITASEQRRLRELSVGVVGLSVGHAIAHTLVLEGLCGRIRLADSDEIELSNLNRIPGTIFDLGLNKAVTAARRIAELDPYVDVSIEPAGLDAESVDRFVDGLDLLIEECDSFDMKLILREAARRHRVPLIMETSDRGLLDVERFDLEPDRPLFHGLLGDVQADDLAGLSPEQKIVHALRLIEPEQLSAAMAASLIEVGETVSSWPQLGGEISLGAATVANAVRRLGLGESLPSGRVRVDIDALVGGTTEPASGGFELADDVCLVPDPVPAEAAAAVLHAAHLAPSGGNAQPWQLIQDDKELRIHLDAGRPSTLDVAFRGSHVAIGAALFNARVAAARHGILGATDVFPNGEKEAPVAVLRFSEAGEGRDGELAALYDAMLRRVSNRHPNEPKKLQEGVVPTLRQAARHEGAEAHVVTHSDQLAKIAEILGEADRIRFLTERLHREMIGELRWPGANSLDTGLDVRTLDLGAAGLAKLRVAQRADVMALLAEQDGGRALGHPTRHRIKGAAGLLVVTVSGSEPADYVRGGQAAERAWIEAGRLGLAVHPMSPVFIYAVDDADCTELSSRFSERLRTLRQEFINVTGIGERHIALIMRIGYAAPVRVRSKRLRVNPATRPAS